MAATAPRRDNRSAFFSRLPFCAKSAMAEILVSDRCERRPPLFIGGRFTSQARGKEGGNFMGCIFDFAQPGLFFPLHLTTKYKWTSRERRPPAPARQISSGTIAIAPHGHSWAHTPQPLQ
jgi:hypothetical protein